MKSNKSLKLLILFAFLLTTCTSDDSPFLVFEDELVVDELKVEIAHDYTPGFKYPLLIHKMDITCHLTSKGSVCNYFLRSPTTSGLVGVHRDYAFLQEKGYKFSYHGARWNDKLIEVGTKTPYYIELGADFENGQSTKHYNYEAETKIALYKDGIQPEKDCIQLTGPLGSNLNPNFSDDGQYVYYDSYRDQRGIFRCDKYGNNEKHILTYNESDNHTGPFNIINNKIVYIFRESENSSKIIFTDLYGQQRKEYRFDCKMSLDKPYKLANTNKFINKLYTEEHKEKVITADILTGDLDTLFSEQNWSILSVSSHPVKSEVYLIVYENSIKKVYKYDYELKEISVFDEDPDYWLIKFSPNVSEYATLKNVDKGFKQIFINTNGNESQLTTYPSYINDFEFSPDGKYILFSTERRNEYQCWKIKL